MTKKKEDAKEAKKNLDKQLKKQQDHYKHLKQLLMILEKILSRHLLMHSKVWRML